jgi:hypothetical protein
VTDDFLTIYGNAVPESKSDVTDLIRLALRLGFNNYSVEVDGVTSTYIRIRVATGERSKPFTYYHIHVRGE